MSGYIELYRTGDTGFYRVLELFELAGYMYHNTSEWVESSEFNKDNKSYLELINEAIKDVATPHETARQDEQGE